MWGVDLLEMIEGSVALVGYATLGLAIKEYRARCFDFHRKWKEATRMRENMEEEKDTEIVELRALVLAYDGVFDAEEEARLAKQAKLKSKEEWRIRNGRGYEIDPATVRKRVRWRAQGYTEEQIREKLLDER